jgi:hypothetical protein
MNKSVSNWPKTIDEAVDKLLELIPKMDQLHLKDTPENELIMYHFSLGMYIRNQFGLWKENKELLRSCAGKGRNFIDPDDASMVIIEALWKRLQSS